MPTPAIDEVPIERSTLRVTSLATSTSRRGAEVFASDLADGLAARSVTVDRLALVRGSGDDLLPVTVLGRRRLGYRTIRRLRRALRAGDALIGHGSSTLPAGLLGSFGTRVPFVYRNVGDPRYWAADAVRRTRTGAMLRRVAHVVALTERAAVALQEVYGLDRQSITVIPKGVPASRFPATDTARRAAARAALGLPASAPIVLFVGALSAEKRPDLAIDTVSRLDHDVQLVVVGDGPLRAEVETNAATRLGARSVVVGQTADVARYLQAADALLLTSDTEGLPGVLMEAGMTAIPVVSTRVGWVDEIVVDASGGYLAPAGDVDALADGLARALGGSAEMGAAARAHCLAHFEIGPIADRWAALLRAVRRDRA